MENKVFKFGKSEYLIYDNGDIYSKNMNRFLPHHNNGNGYKVVNLWSGTKQKQFYVHRLVATCFLSNLENLSDVNHIDLNKSNNNVNNLEWCSRLDNMKHAHSNRAFKNNYLKIDKNHNNWIGQKLGNREVIEVCNEKSKSGNYKVLVRCICGHIFKMYYNDFKKNKNNMQCIKCRWEKNKDKGEDYDY